MKILLTGSSGFIGANLVSYLKQHKYTNYDVRAAVRKLNGADKASLNIFEVGELNGNTDFSEALDGVDIVIHLAGRAHLITDTSSNSLSEFRKVNVDGTLNLAKQSAMAGVKRFIFISSIGVNGINSCSPFTEFSNPVPHDFYSVSKYEAEIGLRSIGCETNMELVVIRPPLVYGSNAPGNFAKLIKLLSYRVPLPFGLINNHRTMIYVQNLVDFIAKCIDHPLAANETFLISDEEDISLRELAIYIRGALGQPVWLVPVPMMMFYFVGKLIGKQYVVDRLLGDLQIDSSKARALLGWVPPYNVKQAVYETAIDFKNRSQ